MAKYNMICLHKNIVMIENIRKQRFLGTYLNKGKVNRLLKHTRTTITDGVKVTTFTNKRTTQVDTTLQTLLPNSSNLHTHLHNSAKL
jgi:hypothetical protein